MSGNFAGIPWVVVHGRAVFLAVSALVPGLFAARAALGAKRHAGRKLARQYAALGPRCEDPAKALELPAVALSGVLEGLPAGLRVPPSMLDKYELFVACGETRVALDGPLTFHRGAVDRWADGHPMYALARGDRVLVRGRVVLAARPVDSGAAYRAVGEGFALVPAEHDPSMRIAYDGPLVSSTSTVARRAAVGALQGVALLAVCSLVAWAFAESAPIGGPNACALQTSRLHVLAAASPSRDAALSAMVRRAASPICATPDAEERVRALESLQGRSCSARLESPFGQLFGDPARAARYFEGCTHTRSTAASHWYRAGELRRASERFAAAADAGEGAFSHDDTGAAVLHLLVGDYVAAERALASHIVRIEGPTLPVELSATAHADSSEAGLLRRRLVSMRNTREFLRYRSRGNPSADWAASGDDAASMLLHAPAVRGGRELERYLRGVELASSWRPIANALIAARVDELSAPPDFVTTPLVSPYDATKLWRRPSSVDVGGLHALERVAYERLAAERSPVAWRLLLRAQYALRVALGESALGAHEEAAAHCSAAMDDLRAYEPQPSEGLRVVPSQARLWAAARAIQTAVHLRAGRLPPALPELEGVAWEPRAVFDAIARLRSTGSLAEFTFAPRAPSPSALAVDGLYRALLVARPRGDDELVNVLHEFTYITPGTGQLLVRGAPLDLVRISLNTIYAARPDEALPAPSSLIHKIVERSVTDAFVGVDSTPVLPRAVTDPRARADCVALATRADTALVRAVVERLSAPDPP